MVSEVLFKVGAIYKSPFINTTCGFEESRGIRINKEKDDGTIRLIGLASNVLSAPKDDLGNLKWVNTLDEATSIWTFCGDNSKGKIPTKTEGNRAFKMIFETEDRSKIPPFFVFRNDGTLAKGSFYFLGVAVPGTIGSELRSNLEEKEQYDAINYIAHFTIIDINEVRKDWLDDLKTDPSEKLQNAPDAWRQFIENGVIIPFYNKAVASTINGSSLVDSSETTLVDDSNNFFSYLLQNNLHYGDQSIVERFLLSIKAKPFVILSGGTGTGKTQLALKYGEFIKEHYGGSSILVPVRSNWTEPRHIIGFYNAFDGKYVDTPAFNFIKSACKDENKDKPYLLILDEMNLSHVEYYFSDILSAMESKTEIELDTNGTKLAVPNNLIIVGTINQDETTLTFSPKVLDRANVVEFPPARVSDYLSMGNIGSTVHPSGGDHDYLYNPMSGIEVRGLSAPQIVREMGLTEADFPICVVKEIGGPNTFGTPITPEERGWIWPGNPACRRSGHGTRVRSGHRPRRASGSS